MLVQHVVLVIQFLFLVRDSPLPFRRLTRFVAYRNKYNDEQYRLGNKIYQRVVRRMRYTIYPRGIPHNESDKESGCKPTLPCNWSPSPTEELTFEPVFFWIVFDVCNVSVQ